MPQLRFDRQVSFSPEQMLALVADLESYPNFVPNCTDMDVSPATAGAGKQQLARMSVQFGPLSQSYTSRVTIDPSSVTVRAEAVDGPFSHLDSIWSFHGNDTGCEILFEIDFGFSNRLLAAAAEPAFSLKQDEIMDAFVAEAMRRYG